ncbi:hypothetical protein SCHIN_v1c02250 [Spiroplasma chinense]|uniref:Uncharacterized protein n=1 Tax=Spiroplasma chinense TaxID=216932 RepID=A0A5B9Y5W3_9MOLU|nr:hypothetical protein [Spiroplasma chinense]QEH61422.1 hypothetical protein SCHIN_v1c02250 [Spiroplasma chinense]
MDYPSEGDNILNAWWFISDSGSTPYTFIDNIGVNISTTIEGAKKIQFDKQSPILYKKFYLYNPNGEIISEDYNEENALSYLTSTINIKENFINKKELNNLENEYTDFDDLISNGKYNVYSFSFENRILYFNNYENALNAYKNNINLITGVKIIYRSRRVYVYNTGKELITFYRSTEEEMKEIISKIYMLINNGD